MFFKKSKHQKENTGFHMYAVAVTYTASIIDKDVYMFEITEIDQGSYATKYSLQELLK